MSDISTVVDRIMEIHQYNNNPPYHGGVLTIADISFL